MVTITRHISINFFQREHFSTMKFGTGYEKTMSFLVIPKSPKVEKIGLCSFNETEIFDTLIKPMGLPQIQRVLLWQMLCVLRPKKNCLTYIWQKRYAKCLFFFLENELCEIWEFLFYGVFGPLFWEGRKNWARRTGLCGKSEFTYLCTLVCKTNLFFFLGLMQPSMFTLNPPSSLYNDSPLSLLLRVKIHYHVMLRFTL